ncbi:MAG: methyltransferase [Planctomycetes bacterium]|nr:methyltransferase [Planctomycetota bacterium]
MEPHEPRMSPERAERLRRWHEEASAELHALGAQDVTYMGLQLHVPEQVFGPTPTSDLLGREVVRKVRPSMRVLDMGCGAGANAILAAAQSDDVVGVDVNPHAVDAAKKNAECNYVQDRTTFRRSDLFETVDGDFDLIVIDPPFRWFPARDLLELAFSDEDYGMLTRFFREAPGRLRAGGSILLFFGTSADVVYLDELIAQAGLLQTTVAKRTIEARGELARYFVLELWRSEGDPK